MRVSDLILPEVREALRGDVAAIAELVEELHPADTADVYKALDPEEQGVFLRALPMKEQVELIEELEAEVSAQIVEDATPERAAQIVEEMSPDERADLFRELPPPIAQQLLAAMPKDEARDVKTLLAWPEGTAGSLMTTDFVALEAELTVQQAIERIRQVAEEMETIYYAYAVSPEGALRGVVSLRGLVTARPEQKISDLMEAEHLITVRPDADQEEVAMAISKYDLLAVPVVGDSGHILGIVTVDDVVDVVQDEATEDLQMMAAISPLDESYFRSSFLRVVRSRAGWLVLLFVGGFFTTHALEAYQDSLALQKILVIFIPLIISSGGNTGSQSAGLLIRAMALGEVVPGQWGKVLIRELASGLLLGTVLGAIGLAWAGVGMDATLRVSFVVGLAVMLVVLWGSIVGALMPMLIRRLGLDPAVASAPMIATMSDVAGIMIYMSVARLLLELI